MSDLVNIFCKNCTFYAYVESAYGREAQYRCLHRSAKRFDLVTGEETVSSMSCDSMRKTDCGIRGGLYRKKVVPLKVYTENSDVM